MVKQNVPLKARLVKAPKVADPIVQIKKCVPLESAGASDMKGSTDKAGEYYVHDNPLETINVMEFLAKEWIKNGIPPEKVCDLLQVAKYLSPRLGRKGTMEDLDKDLFKIENYAHRARTGKWLDPEK